ncbi:UNVERIFIED_CONTAM: hypothetical protein NCL1_31385 [Trichonephila clavipes]
MIDKARNLIFFTTLHFPEYLQNKYVQGVSHALDHLKSWDCGYQFRKEYEISKRSSIMHIECMHAGYRDIYKRLTNRPSSKKLFSYFMVPKNKSIEIVSSSDESDSELIHHRKMSALDYDE